jgi:hypothetical protein
MSRFTQQGFQSREPFTCRKINWVTRTTNFTAVAHPTLHFSLHKHSNYLSPLAVHAHLQPSLQIHPLPFFLEDLSSINCNVRNHLFKTANTISSWTFRRFSFVVWHPSLTPVPLPFPPTPILTRLDGETIYTSSLYVPSFHSVSHPTKCHPFCLHLTNLFFNSTLF